MIMIRRTQEYKAFTRQSILSQNLGYSDLMETV